MALAEDKHAQIIDAAVAEFRERGFSGVSMDRVSARAQVSKRTVYNHFENKEALFRAILDIMASQANRSFEITYDPARPIQPQLIELGWAEGRLLIDPDFMKLARMVVGETMRDPDLAAEMNDKMARIAVFEEFIGDAARAGALAIDDVARAAEQFLGLIKATGFWPVIFSGELLDEAQMTRLIEDSVSVFLNSYLKGKG
ncbi:MAG: TetR/AcrR family transcriptional regulator [Paracoccaceae bacterium]